MTYNLSTSSKKFVDLAAGKRSFYLRLRQILSASNDQDLAAKCVKYLNDKRPNLDKALESGLLLNLVLYVFQYSDPQKDAKTIDGLCLYLDRHIEAAGKGERYSIAIDCQLLSQYWAGLLNGGRKDLDEKFKDVVYGLAVPDQGIIKSVVDLLFSPAIASVTRDDTKLNHIEFALGFLKKMFCGLLTTQLKSVEACNRVSSAVQKFVENGDGKYYPEVLVEKTLEYYLAAFSTYSTPVVEHMLDKLNIVGDLEKLFVFPDIPVEVKQHGMELASEIYANYSEVGVPINESRVRGMIKSQYDIPEFDDSTFLLSSLAFLRQDLAAGVLPTLREHTSTIKKLTSVFRQYGMDQSTILTSEYFELAALLYKEFKSQVGFELLESTLGVLPTDFLYFRELAVKFQSQTLFFTEDHSSVWLPTIDLFLIGATQDFVKTMNAFDSPDLVPDEGEVTIAKDEMKLVAGLVMTCKEFEFGVRPAFKRYLADEDICSHLSAICKDVPEVFRNSIANMLVVLSSYRDE